MAEKEELSAETLGQINLMQSVVIQLPDEDTQLSFVCRGFKDIEGVEGVSYQKTKRDASASPDSDIQIFPIVMDNGREMNLLFHISDHDGFAPYTPYIRNFCKMLAVIFNQKEQKKINNDLIRDMNRQVQERTRALEEVMEERISTAEALQKSEERLELALYGANDGIWDWHLDTNEVHFDERYYTQAGYEPGDFPEALEEWQNHLHPDDKEDAMKETLSYIRGERNDFDIEFRFRHKNGKYIWIRSRGKIVSRNEQGEPLRFIGTHSDISELKSVQDAYKNEKERLEITLRSIGEGVIATDLNGIIQEINITAEELTGCRKEEALGLNLIELFPPLASIEKQLFQFPVESKDTTVFETPEGNQITLSYTTSPIRDETGNILGVILVLKDISEEIKLRESAQRSSKLDSLGLLAGGIAHDFNNLLGGIYGNLELASLEDSSKIRNEYLQKAGETIDRAKSLTRQLLTFAKGGAPTKRIQEMGPLISETVEFALSGSNVKCELNIQKDLYNCNADKEQISQVLDNLVINALQAMPKGGTVHVQAKNLTQESEDFIKISIGDEGEGISPQNQERIFDPFFTTKSMGQGLGLSTCYSIIQRHGGIIEFQSEPGLGSTFDIILPASKNSVEPVKNPLPADIIGKGHILILDDENMISTLLEKMLKSLGFSAQSFSRGEDLLEYFEGQNPENPTAMIFDLTIPGGLGGEETLKSLKGKGIECPVFVSSGYATDPIVSHPETFGFAGSLSKPFHKKELISLLRPLIEKPSGQEDKAVE